MRRMLWSLAASAVVSTVPAVAFAVEPPPQPVPDPTVQQQQPYSPQVPTAAGYTPQAQPRQQYYYYPQQQQQQNLFGRMMEAERRKNNFLLRMVGIR